MVHSKGAICPWSMSNPGSVVIAVFHPAVYLDAGGAGHGLCVSGVREGGKKHLKGFSAVRMTSID